MCPAAAILEIIYELVTLKTLNAMITHETWLAQLFNTYLAGFGNWILSVFHLTAADPKEPWADFIVMQLLVAAIMIVLFLILRSRLSVDKPGKLQHSFELVMVS